ncbi:MAG TPA: HmuY family protein [candidate division Zixibacteria bacterium]|nr:HmuY family protein [candidate division Zixibacteria bacterium]
MFSHITKTRLAIAAACVALALTGCNDKKPTNSGTGPTPPALGEAQIQWDNTNDAWLTILNANDPTMATKVYYSFSASNVVTPADPDNSTDWDLAFSYTDIYVNPNFKSVNLTDMGMMKNFMDVGMMDMPDTSQFMGSAVQYVVDDWYIYNFMTHQLTMTNYVYTMLDAGGANYAKFRIDSITNAAAPPSMGTIWISYVYQPVAGNADLSGAVQTASLDGSSGMVYFDFSTGSSATPANPETSMDWDFRLNNYNFELNNELFGAGDSRAYKVYIDMTDGTDISELTAAPIQAQAYTADTRASAFDGWFTYTGPPLHQILSNGDIYGIYDGTTYYKVTIVSWYTIYDGAPKSANFQVLWEELQ